MTRALLWRRRRALAGFTLLEVMVAMAILAIALTAIFSSEGAAIRTANRAERTAVATLLARCKMAEIEEQVAKEGIPAVSDDGTDGCCEHAEWEGFTCDWKIERIVLPDRPADAEEGPGGPGGGPGGSSGPSVDEMLKGGAGVGGGFAAMAMQYVYPSLKPAVEDQVRRATVTVKWMEGSREHHFDVIQYLVAEQALIPNSQ